MISIDLEKKINTYQGKQTLKISATFPAGSIIKVFGESGAGKTTFLKMIAGFILPETGKIIVARESWLDTVAGLNLPPQKRRTGFVFQDYALFPHMNVLQHLQYASNDTQWINRLLKAGKLETLVDHTPQFLSGGQQQRLAILRALSIRPKLMLMDEPFSALDFENKTALISELKQLFLELGTTVFIASHNPQEIEGLSADSANIFELVIKHL
eukprot:gene11928-12017_t